MPLRLLLLGLGLVSALLAQPSPAPAAKAPPTFTAIAWFGAVGDLGLSPAAGQPFSPLTIFAGSRSTPYPLTGDSIDLFRQVPGENGPVLLPALSVPIPPGMRQPLLVLFADRTSSLTAEIDPATINYHARVLEDSPETFPPDTAHFVNFTPREILARFGQADARLPSFTNTVLRPASPDPRSVRLQIAAQDATSGELQYLVNAPLRRVAGQRILAFLYLVGDGPLEPRFIYDTPIPPEPAP